jgi:Zinc-finger double-stranded RNA-binding
MPFPRIRSFQLSLDQKVYQLPSPPSESIFVLRIEDSLSEPNLKYQRWAVSDEAKQSAGRGNTISKWVLRFLTCMHRDLDQVKGDIASSKHLAGYRSTKAAEDLPGLGEWYCIECAKWFEGEHNLLAHRKGKNHKRRLVL